MFFIKRLKHLFFSYHIKTSHFPFRFPFNLRIYSFSFKEATLFLTVRSDFPILFAISFCVMFGFSTISLKIANSSKGQFKVQILPFETFPIYLHFFSSHQMLCIILPRFTAKQYLRYHLIYNPKSHKS